MGRYAGGSSHTLHSTPQLLPLPEGRCFHKALGLNRHSKTSGTPCFCKAKQSNFRPHSWGCSAPLRSAGLQSPAQGLPHTHGTHPAGLGTARAAHGQRPLRAPRGDVNLSHSTDSPALLTQIRDVQRLSVNGKKEKANGQSQASWYRCSSATEPRPSAELRSNEWELPRRSSRSGTPLPLLSALPSRDNKPQPSEHAAELRTSRSRYSSQAVRPTRV